MIKDLLRQKLGITNIYDVVVGSQINFENSSFGAAANGVSQGDYVQNSGNPKKFPLNNYESPTKAKN